MTTRKTLATIGAAGLMWALIAAPADAWERFGKGGGKVKGHVIKVEQQVRTENDGEATRLTIRTRKGDEMQLHLGNSENCQGCVQVGDKIQARLQGARDANGARQVRSMKVRRGGEMFNLQNNGAGSMVRQQEGLKDGSGAGRKNQGHNQGQNQGQGQGQIQARDGSNCNDSGLRSGRGGAKAGGGSRGGGGGGGGGRG